MCDNTAPFTISLLSKIHSVLISLNLLNISVYNSVPACDSTESTRGFSLTFFKSKIEQIPSCGPLEADQGRLTIWLFKRRNDLIRESEHKFNMSFTQGLPFADHHHNQQAKPPPRLCKKTDHKPPKMFVSIK